MFGIVVSLLLIIPLGAKTAGLHCPGTPNSNYLPSDCWVVGFWLLALVGWYYIVWHYPHSKSYHLMGDELRQRYLE